MAELTDPKSQPSQPLDFQHPLFLHPADTQAITLVSQVLLGTQNYAVWSRAMRLALLGKNKLGFVEGTCLREHQEDRLKEQWDRCNAVVLSWLINSVDKDIASGMVFTFNSHAVWQDLKERFDVVDGARIFSLYRSISSLSQGTMSVSTYYARLKELWDEHAALVPIPSCQCISSRDYSKTVQEQRLFQFLMGLNEVFHQVRSQILLMSSLSSPNQAYSMVTQEETQRQLSYGPQSAPADSTVMVSHASNPIRGGRGQGRGRGRGSSQDVCSYCNKRGHQRESCYQLIGFPPGFPQSRNKRSGEEQANPAINDGQNKPFDKDQDVDQVHQPPFFTQEQYKKILDMLKRDSDPHEAVVSVQATAPGHVQWDDQRDW